MDKDDNYSYSEWKDGLISGLEQRIASLEMGNSAMGQRLKATDDAVVELQGYVAEQTPFEEDRDESTLAYTLEVADITIPELELEITDLIDTLRVAHKGLKPGATTHQQNVAYYAVRGMLSTEID